MKPEFECGFTASFLSSGRILSNVSNCAALMAGAGLLLGHSRPWFAGSLLCWPLTCYFAVRVAIDASLFRELAAAPVEAGRELDEMLHARQGRTISERSAGALKLWKYLIAALAVQLLILAAALFMS